MDTVNHATKKRFVEALFSDGWEALASTTHPDFELHEPDALPYGGIWKGVDGFKACWAKIRQGALDTEHLETVRTYFADDEDHLVCLLHARGKVRATGEPFDSLVCEQWEFKDGRIHRIRVYWFNPPNSGARPIGQT